jgi:hypothetical protein
VSLFDHEIFALPLLLLLYVDHECELLRLFRILVRLVARLWLLFGNCFAGLLLLFLMLSTEEACGILCLTRRKVSQKNRVITNIKMSVLYIYDASLLSLFKL